MQTKELTFFKTTKQRLLTSIVHSFSLIVFVYLAFHKYQEGSIGSAIFFLLFSLVPILSLLPLITNRPTVVVNEKGLKNNTNMMGLIDWKFIDRFEARRIFGRNILVIHVTDHNQVLQHKNLIARSLMKTNIKRLGSPVALGEMEFNEPLAMVIEKLEGMKQLYRSH